MKKTWLNAEVEELVIEKTANGDAPSEDYDGTWVQIGEDWYLPGNNEKLS